MNRLVLYSLPLLFFCLLGLFLWQGLDNNPQELPSALVGRSLPEFELEKLLDEGAITKQDLLGQPFLLNVWATWCPSCAEEHEYLNQLASEGIHIVGMNYKDDIEKARLWLSHYGNPYQINFVDAEGEFAIDLGVYGAPETFFVDSQGIIHYRHVGVVNDLSWQQSLKSQYDRLQ